VPNPIEPYKISVINAALEANEDGGELPAEDGKVATLKSLPLKDGEKGVVIQRDRISYAIAPNLPCGLVTPEQLRKIADVAERFGCTTMKLTSAERIALIGLAAEDIDLAWSALGMPAGAVTGDAVRSVKVCPGTLCCKRGQQDSLVVGQLLDARYHGKAMPGKLKIGVSGCPNQCAETGFKDIGLVGTKPGWDLLVGGSGGANPKIAVRIAKRRSTDEVLGLVDGVLAFYVDHARPKERLYRLIERLGMRLLMDALGLPEEQLHPGAH